MEKVVKLDNWGYEVTTSSQACISAINAYYHQVLSYGREKHVILEAVAHDKDCTLANILASHFLHSSDPSKASFFLDSAKSNLEQATLYERLVFDAVSYLISKDRDDDVAYELHAKLLKEFPRDLVSLKRAQVLCFITGRPDLSLSLVHQVLPQNKGESFIYGMLSFPSLELGRMKEAEEAAKRGFEINKQDSWAHHALCHIYQYECRFKEAVEFMEECSPSWSSCSSFMLTHNWWHVALCYLEGNGPMNRVLEIYDHHIWRELDQPDAVAAEVYLNAAGLLLRLCVRGEMDIIGDRLKILAEYLTDKDFEDDEKEATKAVYAYGSGNDRHGLEILGPDFDAHSFKLIGASDEQLDVFNEVWYIMLLNAGEAIKAIEVFERRIEKRQGFAFLWRLLESAYKLAKMPEEATIANEKARALECAYFQ
ncbi:hypothetical protein Ahy_A03g010992 isoform A [Arachis hypogaea]|uniref:Tetratricopeptide repeat protein 38 n=1 Tax=Arachis hypogaea TaxID=3818 RepID=A0A445DP71_ARAHY|nr:hypothetical protein Ahy_A03g010992 isoform A [Arachis hypogaea]